MGLRGQWERRSIGANYHNIWEHNHYVLSGRYNRDGGSHRAYC